MPGHTAPLWCSCHPTMPATNPFFRQQWQRLHCPCAHRARSVRKRSPVCQVDANSRHPADNSHIDNPFTGLEIS